MPNYFCSVCDFFHSSPVDYISPLNIQNSAMQPESAELCHYCSPWIQGEVRSGNLEHFPTMALLRQSSYCCIMCQYLLVANTISSKSLRQRFIDVNASTIESLPLTVQLKDVPISKSGLTWATFSTSLSLPSRGFIYEDNSLILMCDSECRSCFGAVFNGSR